MTRFYGSIDPFRAMAGSRFHKYFNIDDLEEKLVISVLDNGVGIDEKGQKGLYKLFGRLT